MSKKSTPSITLTDPVSKKSAELRDDQAVRALLVAVLARLEEGGTWRDRLPGDSTERVCAQILRKADSPGQALALVREASTLAAIFQGTDLEEDASGLRNKGTTEALPGLLDDKARDQLVSDVAESVKLIWPTYKAQVESGQGEEKKAFSVKVEFVPESESADAYTRVLAEMKVSTTETTRTSKVRRLRGGRWQLELFATPSK